MIILINSESLYVTNLRFLPIEKLAPGGLIFRCGGRTLRPADGEAVAEPEVVLLQHAVHLCVHASHTVPSAPLPKADIQKTVQYS